MSKNTVLTYLVCTDIPITHIDVSANTALTHLHVCGTQITNLDVSKNTALRVLCIRRNQLTTDALNDLFKALPEKKSAGGAIDSSGNPGTNDCDHDIWKEKGWVYANLHR